MTTETTTEQTTETTQAHADAARPAPAAPTRKPCPKWETGEGGKLRLKDPDAPRLTYREIMGVPDVDAATAEVGRLSIALQMLERGEDRGKIENEYLPLIASIGPKDAVEMALATQFVVTHAMTMRLMGLTAGTVADGAVLVGERFVNLLTKLQRTQIALADALARGRGKNSSQTIRIERVDVAEGGQVAITGKVVPGGRA
ncbi:MAG: hypothetical protein KJ042_05055 [Deltaproteobacteria bacterium]|nr:hypothetical protein [Deltaproteobacteria bacterium]